VPEVPGKAPLGSVEQLEATGIPSTEKVIDESGGNPDPWAARADPTVARGAERLNCATGAIPV
jgi:hypothetical protein